MAIRVAHTDFDSLCAYARAMYRRFPGGDPSLLRAGRDGVVTYLVLQLLSSQVGRKVATADEVADILGVSIPLIERGFQMLDQLPVGPQLSEIPPVFLGWVYQIWNESRRDAETWGVSSRSKPQSERVDIGVVTQVFTDQYIADFLVANTVRGQPDGFRAKRSSAGLSVCDPACGAGHILASAVRFFLSQGGAASGIDHSVHGFDIDPEAVEVCRLVVFMEYLRSGYGGDRRSLWSSLQDSIRTVDGPYGTLDRSEVSSECAFDVVITNPPYLGRRKLSNQLRVYLDRHYPAARVDLCAAFMQRCVEMTRLGGAVGFVTTDKWLRLTGYAGLREGDGKFLGLLRELSFDVICELGARAFHSQIALHDGVRVSLLCARRIPPQSNHTCAYLNVTEESSYNEKEKALYAFGAARTAGLTLPLIVQDSLADGDIGRTLLQKSDVPSTLSQSTVHLRDQARVMVGLQTSDDARYVRYVWEIPPDRNRWRIHAKGGGYTRWCGNNRWIIDWEPGRHAYVRSKGALVAAEQLVEQAGWTYSWFANGSLGLRVKDPGWSVGRAAASGVFCDDPRIVGFLNSRFASACARSLGGKIQLPEGVVRRIPIPSTLDEVSPELIRAATMLKRHIVEVDPTDALFDPTRSPSWREMLVIEALLLLVEGSIELQVQTAIGASASELAKFNMRCGVPVAWIAVATPGAWQRFWQNVPEALQWIGPQVYSTLNSIFESGTHTMALAPEITGRALRESPVQVRRLLPSTGRLEALCRDYSVNPLDVVAACSSERGSYSTLRHSLEKSLLHVRVLVELLQAMNHRWWSSSDPVARDHGGCHTLVNLCEIVNASSDCVNRARCCGQILDEVFLREFLSWQQKLFAQRPPIRPVGDGTRGPLIFGHAWDFVDCSTSASVAGDSLMHRFNRMST